MNDPFHWQVLEPGIHCVYCAMQRVEGEIFTEKHSTVKGKKQQNQINIYSTAFKTAPVLHFSKVLGRYVVSGRVVTILLSLHVIPD